MKKESGIRSMLSILVLLVICRFGLNGCTLAGPTAATATVGEISLSKSRADILVTEDENLVKGCKLIKEVQANSYWGGLFFQDKALEKTIADMTHESAEAGANVLLIKSKSKSFGGSTSEGAAYLCPTTEKTASPTENRPTDISHGKSDI